MQMPALWLSSAGLAPMPCKGTQAGCAGVSVAAALPSLSPARRSIAQRGTGQFAVSCCRGVAADSRGHAGRGGEKGVCRLRARKEYSFLNKSALVPGCARRGGGTGGRSNATKQSTKRASLNARESTGCSSLALWGRAGCCCWAPSALLELCISLLPLFLRLGAHRHILAYAAGILQQWGSAAGHAVNRMLTTTGMHNSPDVLHGKNTRCVHRHGCTKPHDALKQPSYPIGSLYVFVALLARGVGAIIWSYTPLLARWT